MRNNAHLQANSSERWEKATFFDHKHFCPDSSLTFAWRYDIIITSNIWGMVMLVLFSLPVANARGIKLQFSKREREMI